MANRSRSYLKEKFEDGDRPTGEHFSDIIDSVINKVDDNIQLDSDGNLSIPAGLKLSGATNGQDGTLRFNAGQVEISNGGVWSPISGGSGSVFVPVGGGTDVAYSDGNVGVGTFVSNPAHKLDVPLNANTGAGERVRLGNMIAHNGQTNDAAYIAANQAVINDENFALRQDDQANTTVNAGTNSSLQFTQGTAVRTIISTTGNISLLPDSSVFIDGTTVIGTNSNTQDLFVFGKASKPGGGGFLNISSDSRLKKDVKELEFGLKEIKNLKPVNYSFNGKAGTPDDGDKYVGLIAQDVQKVIPSLIIEAESLDEKDKKKYLNYDPNPLMYIMINAIKELSEKVDKLESQLKERKRPGR